MSKVTRIAVVVAVAGAVVAVIAIKASKGPPERRQPPPALPRPLELGGTKCTVCKMMKPVLEGLAKEFAGKLHVEMIDVHQDPDAAERYDVRVIPTQVFLDASGRELFRHEGFFSRAEIVAAWFNAGVDLIGPAATRPIGT